MRIVGPNCLGTVSVRERAIGTFSVALENEMPSQGGVSIVSQSGNVGSAALRQLGGSGAGVARFIATGNEADVQAGDAIAWLADDEDTSVILCCLETCRDGPRLVQALDRARAAGKPVVILKIGTSEVGQKAALSHTGGLAGIDTTGTLWTRSPGQDWEHGHTVTGTPQAVAVDGARIYVADDRGIAVTEDAGATWIVLEVNG